MHIVELVGLVTLILQIVKNKMWSWRNEAPTETSFAKAAEAQRGSIDTFLAILLYWKYNIYIALSRCNPNRSAFSASQFQEKVRIKARETRKVE